MLAARSFNKSEPIFQIEKVTLAKAPPTGAAKSSEPFIVPTQPADQPLPVDRCQPIDQLHTDQVSALQQHVPSTSSTEAARQLIDPEMDTDLDDKSTDRLLLAIITLLAQPKRENSPAWSKI